MVEWIGLSFDQIALLKPLISSFGSTLILFTVIIILRSLTSKFIARSVVSTELRRRWLVQVRNGAVLLLLLGLVMIWGEELRALALSIVAIAAAFVVATKELILCVIGSILKTGSGSFNIGDRIQVKDFRGDVIDQNLLSTTILEVGPGKLTHQRTGRMAVIPNGIFVSEPVINESYSRDYVFHVFTVPFHRNEDWQLAQQALLASANKHCDSYLETARTHMLRVSDRRGLDSISVNPKVTIQVPNANEIHLVVRFPAKSAQRSFIEQSILAEVLSKDFSRNNSNQFSAHIDDVLANKIDDYDNP